MSVELHVTTAVDPDLQPLVAAQEAEVMARYGVDDTGPALSGQAPCLLARSDGRPVGCVALGRLSDAVGEVRHMYVDPAARGHRIGRLLLPGVDLAADCGYRLLRLETGTQQPEAVGLYGTAGWSRIDCDGSFEDDPMTICFEKSLVER